MNENGKAGTIRTLDQHFKDALANWPDAQALADPGNRQLITEGAPRSLTFAEADAAVSRLAAHFLQMGLKPLDVVLVQLPNTVETPLILLALSRAGLIAALVPVPWGLHEVRKAAASIRPRAIISCGYLQNQQPADRMRFCAFDTPSVRFVFGFGTDLPDGVVGLDEIVWGEGRPEVKPALATKPEHLAIITFEESRSGVQPLARSHAQLAYAADQLINLMEISQGSVLICPYLLSSLTGLAGGLMAWLTSGCKLVLHHPFSSAALTADMERHTSTHLLLPATVAASKAGAQLIAWPGLSHLTLGWPQRKVNVYPSAGIKTIDVVSLGELALHASLAKEPGAPRLPLGPLHAFINGEKVTVLETRLKGGSRRNGDIAGLETALEARLQVRGAALPNVLGAEANEEGFCDAGLLACPVATLPPAAQIVGQAELLAVGGLRFDGNEVANVYAQHDAVSKARIYNETDDLMGTRLVATVQPASGETVSADDLGRLVAGYEMASYKAPAAVNALAQLSPRPAELAANEEDVKAS